MLPVVNGLVVTLFGAQNVRNVLIIVVQISLGKTFCFHIGMPVSRTCLDDNYSLNKQEEFKTGEDVSEKVKELCYLKDLFSSYGGASEVVDARLGNTYKTVTGLAGSIFEAT